MLLRNAKQSVWKWLAGRPRLRVLAKSAFRVLWARPLIRFHGIPVVAVTGTNGKSTVVRMLDRILLRAGYRVGMCCTDGVRVNGRWVVQGDESSSRGAYRAVHTEPVQALVAEVARGGIIRHGLGFSRCRVAVVTNVSDDHLGLDGIETLEQMAAVKERPVRRLGPGGTAVLNLDDPRVRGMTPPAGARRVFFSMRRPPVEVRDCFYAHDGFLWKRSAGRDQSLLRTDEVGFARRGLLPYHVANALAVLAALEAVRDALPVAHELAVEVLREFGKDPNDHPYTFTLVEFRHRHVLLDQAKNPAGFRVDCQGISRLRETLGYEHVVGVLSHVGNRDAGFHREIARLAADVCDGLVVVPPKPSYLRGTPPERLVSLLREAVPPEKRLEHPAQRLESLFESVEKTCSKRTPCVLFEPVVLDLEIPLLLQEGVPIAL